MAKFFKDIVPNTFATIIIGEGNESVSLINRMDNRSVDTNLHLTNLSVNQINADTIKYSFSVQYHPNSFDKADTLKLERMVSTILSNRANDDNTIIKVKFGYTSGSPYTRNVRKESYTYVGIILEMKTSVQQNYIEYSFTATGVYEVAKNIALSSELKFTTKDPITEWMRKALGITNASKQVANFATAGAVVVSNLTNSNTSTEVSKSFNMSFDFKCDCEIPSMLELSGLEYKYAVMNLDFKKIASFGAELDNLLDFSEYSPDIQMNKSQGSLTFPSNFNLLTIFKGLCDKINLLCGMEGIKYSKYSSLYNHQFEIVFDSYIVNRGTYGTIYLTDVTNYKNKANFNYVFNYGFINKGDEFIDHTVISWDCDYNATAVIHDSVITNELSVAQSIDKFGNLVSVAANSTPLEGPIALGLNVLESFISAEQNLVKVKQTWAYPYEATLTVLGNPEPIEVCRKVIQVVPMINNSIHHTAGYYLVKSVTHNIDSSMTFTTTYGLIRLDDEHAQLFESGQGNYTEITNQQAASQSQIREYKNYSL